MMYLNLKRNDGSTLEGQHSAGKVPQLKRSELHLYQKQIYLKQRIRVHL